MLALLLGLAACAMFRGEAAKASSPSEAAAGREAEEAEGPFFAHAYEEILGSYIEPVTGSDIVLPGIRRLSVIDPDLAVESDGISVSLRKQGMLLGRLIYPAGDDAAEWARLTETALGLARANSPAIAGIGREPLRRAVFAGVLSPLDRFTRYSPPEEARRLRDVREGSDGVGASLEPAGGEIHVGAVVQGGPAAAAGIRSGDRVVAIDGVPVAGMTAAAASSRLEGPPASRVGLSILREAGQGGAGSALLHFDLTRAHVIPPTVSARAENGIAIIRISSFNEDTRESLAAEIRRLWGEKRGNEKRGALRGIVLDLRNNPGGILEQGVAVAALFLDSGRIAMTTGRNAETDQVYETRAGDITAGLPLAVLVNGRSASAAEIVAAALQDNGRAVVLGSASFGKGTVQAVVPLPDEGELTLTWARILTPAGYGLNGHGVIPSICTSRSAEDGRRTPRMLTRSRARLDEIGWMRLRAACPQDEEEPAADLGFAERILQDRMAYKRALLTRLPGLAAVR